MSTFKKTNHIQHRSLKRTIINDHKNLIQTIGFLEDPKIKRSLENRCHAMEKVFHQEQLKSNPFKDNRWNRFRARYHTKKNRKVYQHVYDKINKNE